MNGSATGSLSRRLLWIAMRLSGKNAQKSAITRTDDASFFSISEEDFVHHVGLSEKEAARLCEKNRDKRLDETLEKLEKLGAYILHFEMDTYPYILPLANALPPILFARGDASKIGSEGVAIVGARKCSDYGKKTARALAMEAAFAGFPIISGAAFGIDTAAHLAALELQRPTVAVLGNGLFHTYPKTSGKLFDEIAQKGLILSQFPPALPPDKKTFPIRNEIIAALSRAVVVVEGSARSGARHTANYAKSLGVRLLAVPGRLGDVNAQLPNQLIGEGQEPIVSVAGFGKLLQGERQIGLPFVEKQRGRLGKGRVNEAERPPKPSAKAHHSLAGEEKKIFEFIGENSVGLDDLLAAAIVQPQALNRILLDLELKGVLLREAGGRYSVVNH